MKKYLYHGSTKLIKGKLIPNRAKDLEKNPENMIIGVYATDIKEVAIAMAIISLDGVIGASLLNYKKGRAIGKIYLGWPKRKYVYLYTLPSDSFRKSKGIKNQYVSTKPVKPIKIEKIIVKNYIHLVEKSTKKETLNWCKKYKMEKLLK